MLETISIPILLKAIDFLFDEGRKILNERRERRKIQRDEKMGENKPFESDSFDFQIMIKSNENLIQSKEVALKIPVSEAAWQESEIEVKHLLRLLEIHTRNYQLAKEQYAKWGSALVPPIIANTLHEEEETIATTVQSLQKILSHVYGKQIEIS